jgi:hypothetical protein
MIVLGALSLLQVALLPGLILARAARVRGGPATLLVAFGASLLINYLAVLALTVLGIYTRPVVLGAFALELVALGLLARDGLRGPVGALRPAGSPRAWLRDHLHVGSAGSGAARVVALAGALFTVLHAFLVYGRQFGEIFLHWDAVVSWDHWAVEWAGGALPRLTQHYPQLLPANLSLIYQFQGTSEVKYFARWFMGAFEVAIPLALFMAAVSRRSTGLFVGTILGGRLMWLMGSRAAGYADTPVACFLTLSVVCLLVADHRTRQGRAPGAVVFLGGVFAAAAAVTKQAGLWIALCYPLLALIVLPSGPGRLRTSASVIGGILLVDALVVLPWYLFKEFAIRAGVDGSELAATTVAAHHGRSLAERVAFAIQLLDGRLRHGPIPGSAVAVAIALLALLGGRGRLGRTLVLLVIVPYVLLWLALWSYDERNLVFVLPLAGVMAGLGLVRLATGGRAMADAAGPRAAEAAAAPVTGVPRREAPRGILALPAAVLLLPLGLALGALALGADDEALRRSALEQQRRIGLPALNERLYAYEAGTGFRGKILTDYQMLLALPGIGRHFLLGYTSQPGFVTESQRPEVGYVLYSREWSHPQVRAHFSQAIASGAMTRIFEQDGWTLAGP